MVPRKHFPQNILVILKRTQPVVKTNELLQTDIWEFIAKIVSWYSENSYEITCRIIATNVVYDIKIAVAHFQVIDKLFKSE